MSRPPSDPAPGNESPAGKQLSEAEAFLSLQEPLVEHVRRTIVENNLEVIIAGASDLNGLFLGKRIPAVCFGERPLASVPVGDVIWILDTEQDAIPPPPDPEAWWPSWSRGGYADIEAIPDLSTLRIVPWLERTGLVLCEYFFTDGRAIEIAPRSLLRRLVRRAESIGSAKFAAEFEFCFFQETEETLEDKGHQALALRTLTLRPRAYGIQRGTTDEHITRPLVRGLEGFGIPIERWHPELGPGQYEVNMAFTDLLDAGDRAFLFKHAVKEIAAQHALMATFMAKPLPSFGSSCHLHQSLWKEDQNLFWDDEREGNLSDLALHYIGGSLAALPDLTLPLAPTLNSYKRLTPHSAAGTTATWSYDNRTTALRILNHDANSCRVENRVAGGDVNPYLAIAASLAGGLYGIENRVRPPAAFVGDAYGDPTVTQLPTSLEEAIAAFESSPIARDFLGEEFVRFYSHTRKWELEQFRANVTDWEVKRYLPFL
jgi:glutamine synthetase